MCGDAVARAAGGNADVEHASEVGDPSCSPSFAKNSFKLRWAASATYLIAELRLAEPLTLFFGAIWQERGECVNGAGEHVNSAAFKPGSVRGCEPL